MSNWTDNWQAVGQRITQLAQKHHREPGSVHLLAVSKTFDAQAVLAVARAGQRHFGENYIQEALDKMAGVRELAPGLASDLVWHCIGPIQSNKTRLVAEHFDWVHTVDRLKIAQRLSEQRPSDRPPLQVLLQVNMDGGANKSGIVPEQVLDLAQSVAQLPHLQLRGLMSIPEPSDDMQQMLQVHQKTHELLLRCRQVLFSQRLDVLSMGMSADLEPAIAAGSTWVRVGTAIFGMRTQ